MPVIFPVSSYRFRTVFQGRKGRELKKDRDFARENSVYFYHYTNYY